MSPTLHIPELARSILICLHLFFLAGAAIAVAFGDYAILRHRVVNRPLLEKSANAVKWVLFALWATGLAVVALDMATAGLSLSGSPKLQAKLTVVLALSFNGWLLHRFTLQTIGLPSKTVERDARIAAALGAVSAASWLYALFLGVAKAWTPVLGYGGFIAGYLAVVVVAVVVALRQVAPVLVLKSEPQEDKAISEEIRLALSKAIGPVAGWYIEENVGLTREEIEASPIEAVERIASVVGADNQLTVRGPGMCRQLFERAAAAVLKERGMGYHAYAF